MDYLRRQNDPGKKDSTPEKVESDPSFTGLRLIDEPAETPEACRKESPVSRRQLINKINHIHFSDGAIRAQFENVEYNRSLSLEMLPQPCLGKYLVCLWTERGGMKQLPLMYRFQELRVITEEKVISVPAGLRAVSKKGICLVLPEKSVQFTFRKAIRYACKPLDVRLIQNGVIFPGTLMNFSAFAFRVEVGITPDAPVHWMNPSYPVSLMIKAGDDTLYAGECRIIKQDEGIRRRHVVIAPLKDSIQRFSPRVYRSRRTTLTPSPDIVFNHPFTDKMVNLKVLNLSGSGIAVEDDEESSMLIPGLILPKMILNFANTFYIDCRAQVVYRRVFVREDNKRIVKCGIAFLDIAPNEHMKLLSMLYQAENKHIYICNQIDLEDLWRFFFETGFIYPRKYAYLYSRKEQIRKTYQTLYSEQSSITRHFTWQQKGKIQAHLSMLRFYEKTWLIHHLAARTDKRIGKGVEMLNQIGAFTYDSHRLVSSHMDFLICYFRPNNRFPNHFFGGVARNIQNPKACSIDAFAYIHFRPRHPDLPLPESWTLEKPDYEDLLDLENAYEGQSGGLMLQALDLLPENEMPARFELATEYQRLGLTRERRLYSLKKDGRLAAIIMANFSDEALNLSDLTNSISVFVTDREQLGTDILYRALTNISGKYGLRKFPVLIYPLEYAVETAVPHERVYHLWALNMQHSDDYFKHYDYLI